MGGNAFWNFRMQRGVKTWKPFVVGYGYFLELPNVAAWIIYWSQSNKYPSFWLTCTHVHIAKESATPEVGRTCELETLVGAPSSYSPDASMQQNQKEEDVWVRIQIGEADSKSTKSAGSTATGQSNEDDMCDSDSTSGSDSEVFLMFHFNL